MADRQSAADRLGLIFMAKAGYDPFSAVGFWRRMADTGNDKDAPPEFLPTHPADQTRIRQIEKRLPEALAYYGPRSARQRSGVGPRSDRNRGRFRYNPMLSQMASE